MGKVIASITTSVDGYITGPDYGPGAGHGVGHPHQDFAGAGVRRAPVRHKHVVEKQDVATAPRKRDGLL